MNWDTIRNCAQPSPESKSAAEFHKTWNKVIDEAESEEREWIERLRKAGFKAAHPNDGWVDRKKNEVFFCYPQFDDGAKEGDFVMLGWPNDERSRSIRLLNEVGFLCKGWKFEYV